MLDVGFALALLQALAGLDDGLQARLAALYLGRNIQLRLVGLGRVGGLGAVQQGINLRLQFRFGLLHALVAHRLVAAGVGFDLGAVAGHRAQLDQAHLGGQLDHLHEQIAQLKLCSGRKSRIVRCLGKFPAPSIRKARSSCSRRSILRELNTPVA